MPYNSLLLTSVKNGGITIEDYKNGLVTPIDNTQGFSTAIKIIANDPDLKIRMADQSRIRFEKKIRHHNDEFLSTDI